MSMVLAGGGGAPNIGGRLSLDTRDFDRGIRGALGGLNDLQRGVLGIRAVFTGAGLGIAATGYGILRAIGAAADGFVEFEANMRNVQSISRATQLNFYGMADAAVEMTSRVRRSAVDLSEGLYEIASSGFDGANALYILEQSAVSASAGLTDTETAAKGVLAVINAYGYSARDAADVSDIMFQTVDVGIGSFEELTSSLGEIVGFAAVAGVQFDEVAAAIATMSLAAVDFQTGSVSLNRLLQAMVDPSDALAAEFQAMGFESGQAALNALGLHGVMERLRVSVGNNAAAWLALLPDIRGVRAALALVANDGENYARIAGDITDANGRAGAAARAFAIQQESLRAQVGRVGIAFRQFMYEGLLPLVDTLSTGVRWIGNAAELLNQLPAPIKAVAVVAGVLVGSLALLVGLLMVALPVAIGLAARAWIRHTIAQQGANLASNEFVMTQYRVVMANQLVASSLHRVTAAARATKLAMAGTVVGILALAAGIVTLGRHTESTEERLLQLSQTTNDELLDGMREMVNLIDGAGRNSVFTTKVLGTWTEMVRQAAVDQPDLAMRIIETAEAAGLQEWALEQLHAEYDRGRQAAADAAGAAESVATTWETTGGTVMEVSEATAEALEQLVEHSYDLMTVWGLLDNPFANQERAVERMADAQGDLERAEQRLADLRAREDRDRQAHLLDIRKAQNEIARAAERAREAEGPIDRESAAIQAANAQQRLNELRAETPGYLRDIADAQAEVEARQQALNDAEAEAIVNAQTLIENMYKRRQAMTEWADSMKGLRELEGVPAGLVQEFVEMGPEGAEAVKAFLEMTPAQRSTFIAHYEEAAREASEAAILAFQPTGEALTGALRQLFDLSGQDLDLFMERAPSVASPEEIATFIRTLDTTAPEVQAAIDRWFDPMEQVAFGLDMELAVRMSWARSDQDAFMEMSRLANLDRDSFTFYMEMRSPDLMERWLDWIDNGAPIEPRGSSPTSGGPRLSNYEQHIADVVANTPESQRGGSGNGRVSRHAEGGIFTSATMGIFGEAGPEAIIPMSRPGRALSLMHQSGLYNMVLRDFQQRAVSYDYSTHTSNQYLVDKVVTQDSDSFLRQMEQRRRADALIGVGGQ